MKKIAILVPGGISTPKAEITIPRLYNLVHRLSMDFNITVYSLSQIPEQSSSFQIDNFKVKSLKSPHLDSVFKKFLYLVLMFSKDHLLERFDLIHGFWAYPSGFFAVILGKILQLPSVVSLQGGEAAYLPQINYGNMNHWLLKNLTLSTCHQADKLTCLTKFQRNEISRFGLGREDIQVIPDGADPSVFKLNSKDLSPPYHFIHVAHLTEVKDQKTLLKTFSLIRQQVECRLRMIGPDYMKGQLQKLAEELNLHESVKFLGLVRNWELPEHYRWAHIMLHTSLYEGAAVVVAEAAASGVVVCGTRVGLIADLGGDYTVSVEVGDYQSLARKTLELLKDDVKYEKLRSKAQKWAQTYDADWTAGRFIQLYNQL